MEIHKISQLAHKLLTYLVRNFSMGEEFTFDLLPHMTVLNLNNKTVVKQTIRKLFDIEALTYDEFGFDSYKIKILKRPEEFILHLKGHATAQGKRDVQDQLAKNEIQRLSNEIQSLKLELLRIQTAKPAAWLWRNKSDNIWRDATIQPPTKEDLDTCVFEPLFRYPDPNSDDVWKHTKSGGDYIILTDFRWEATNTPSTLYLALYDRSVWGRASDIFMDGRFVRHSNITEVEKPRKRAPPKTWK